MLARGEKKEFLHRVALKKAQVDLKVIIANAFDRRGFRIFRREFESILLK
jgi:hypothetical protein